MTSTFIEAGFDQDGESAIVNKRQVERLQAFPPIPSFNISNLYYCEGNSVRASKEHNDSPYDINLPDQAARFLVCRIPPIQTIIEEMNDPNVQKPEDFIQFGMHRTPSIDYFYISRGAVTLHMGNGDTHEFKEGDAYVMRGSDHAWINYGNEPVELVGFMFGDKSKG